MAYTARMDRSPDSNVNARLRLKEIVPGVIEDAEQTSVAMQLGNVRRMKSYETEFRLTESLPSAFWINGTTDAAGGSGDGSQLAKDSAFKQVTSYTHKKVSFVPNEIAVMVVMPDNWRDDSDATWEEVRVKLRTAFAKAIDRAVLFGESDFGPLPANFGDGVIPEAIAAGNFVTLGTGVDRADDYAATAQLLEEGGYDTTGFITGAAEKWNLRRLRDDDNRPLLNTIDGLIPGGITEVKNGTWDKDVAIALAGDFQHLHIGVKQDMTFNLSNTAVIQDPVSGDVLYNAYQQDGEVLRAVMRLGYLVTAPLKTLGGAFPFGVLVPDAPSS